jgi:hypothetical protein
VLAIDDGDLRLPRKLADANGFTETITFKCADLAKLGDPEESKQVDLLLALVYLNDPRRDEEQMRIAHNLCRGFLRPGGEMVPDRVEYEVQPVSWAQQSYTNHAESVCRQISNLEELYGVSLEPMRRSRMESPEKEDFPMRGTDGLIARPGSRALGHFTKVYNHSYRDMEIAPFPERFELQTSHAGNVDVLIWAQRLYYRDLLIFLNESVTWVENPVWVEENSRLVVTLGEKWRLSNRAGIIRT